MNVLESAVDSQNNKSFGYASRLYAESLEEFGRVRELPRCRGWLLEDSIPNSPLLDGMGCYPLFSCCDWNALQHDINSLSTDLVSVRLVTDPFAEVNISQLKATFPDVCYEYKQHFVTDLSLPLEEVVSSHHQRNARKALDAVEVHQSTNDVDMLSHWQSLYDNLIERHAITGIARFSPQSFAKQARVPGFTAFSAFDQKTTWGITLWYVRDDIAYYHLAAYSDRGYDLGASFALFWTALEYFAALGIRWAALGAGAGTTATESGLTRFKRGWSTGTRPAHFCGRILQPSAYAELSANIAAGSSFFPAYRRA
jgi:hypothetical protein